MPRIFDNIEQHLLPALNRTLEVSYRADFCVGYFNLRGWKQINAAIEPWAGGEGHCCRLMVGMQTTPQEELKRAFSLGSAEDGMDNATATRLKPKLAEDFRETFENTTNVRVVASLVRPAADIQLAAEVDMAQLKITVTTGGDATEVEVAWIVDLFSPGTTT